MSAPIRLLLIVLSGAFPELAAGGAASAADFYAGKTINFIVGTDVGGGLHTYARVVGKYLPEHLPGAPTVVVRDMPGAGSAKAAAYLYSLAPKDGTAIGALFPGVIVDQLFQQRAAGQFDATKFTYLGSADSDARICMTGPGSKIRTYDDAMRENVVVGASQVGGSTSDYAFLHKHATGAKFKVVSGYKGTAEVLLAIERHEIEGVCGLDWSSLKTQRLDWVRTRSANILVQDTPLPLAELNTLGVPNVDSFVKDEKDRRAVDLVVSQQIFARPYVAPPGVPEPQAGLLKAALAGVFHDEKFLKDAEDAGLSINAASADAVQQAVLQMYRAPGDVVQRARELIRPSDR